MRMIRRATAAAPLVALSLALAACTGDGDDDPSTGTEGGNDERGDQDEPDAAGPSGTIELAGVQQTHAAGTTVAITAVTVDPSGNVLVDLEALVAGQRGAVLASLTTILEDDLGNRYAFVPPQANGRLEIAQDMRADATLAFQGPIDPDATRVTLGLNGSPSDGAQPISATPANTLSPTFAFEGLPLPGVGLDDEAAGPDDERGLQIPRTDVDVTGVVHEGDSEVRIEVTNVQIEPSLVIVTIEAVNNSGRERNLIQRAPELRAEVDGQTLGNAHPFAFERIITEEGEFNRLSLGPGDEVTASFAFRGVVPPQATGVRMGFQVLVSEVDQGAPTTPESEFSSPAVVFTELPLPSDAAEVSGGADAEGADDTSADDTDS